MVPRKLRGEVRSKKAATVVKAPQSGRSSSWFDFLVQRLCACKRLPLRYQMARDGTFGTLALNVKRTDQLGAAPMRILLVEDHVELASRIAKRIKREGFVVDHVETIEGAACAIDDCRYSVTLLDRKLPDGDGLSLVSCIREKQPGSRILMLTALDAIDNRIEGLNAGADDYLTKPFNLDEMMARIRAHLRRPGGERAPPVEIGALSFDLDARTASVANRPVLFLRRELALLEALVRRAGRVVSRETLISGIYDLDEEIQPHSLTTLVSRLRARLLELNAGVEIHSARGLGYMIAKTKAKAKT